MSAIGTVSSRRRSLSAQRLHNQEIQPTMLRGRVLLVDDSSNARSIIGRILGCFGLTVETAEDGQMGSERAFAAMEQGEAFDLIVADMQMPVMDGYAAVAHLRERGYTGRIVALTGDTAPDARERCIKAGCDDFASKPISFELLFDLAKRNLQAISVRPQVETAVHC